MHVRHSSKDPNHRIGRGLLKALPRACLALVGNGVELNSIVCQGSLFLSEPFGREREVWQDKESDGCNGESYGALKDEQPAPTRQARDIVETIKDASGNQARKGSGEDVASVQNSNTSSDLFASIKDAEKIYCARVIRRFCQSKEEASEK